MAVHLTKIYTRTGDAGTTRLSDNSQISKTDPRLVAYADVDETNSVLGVALATASFDAAIVEVLRTVQNDLFDVGADLSTPVVPKPRVPAAAGHPGLHRPARRLVRRVQRAGAEAELVHPPRRHPGGALLHQARCTARRAERSAWALLEVDAERSNALAAKYLNRLSDLLFILARVANPDGDVLWRPGGGA
ncbi:cob(I)yrinic acid a,c-diamide adenosyltransferase [Saccharopolyspora gregorii]|uniref:Corrinoid adenosyltransferase n=1 Tax=Saccharopolyspora gregorii TaxID=33914 RepID=A0ABP6RJY2_9PSEU